MATKKAKGADEAPKKTADKKGASEAPKKKSVLELVKGMEEGRDITHIELRESRSYLSTGCLTLNLIMGGGYYGGRVLQVFGPEHSGKSTLMYTSAADLHRAGVLTLFFDHEGTTDPKYIKTLGMDISAKSPLFRYYKPKDGNHTYHMMFDLMNALEDQSEGLPQVCFVIDSIATMPAAKEMEEPESKRPALRASMHSDWWGKLKTLVSRKHVAVIAVNQVRSTVGMAYGNPETIPGGNAWKFSTDNLVRVSRVGKHVEVDGDMFQTMRFKTIKNKNFIPSQGAEVYLHLGKGIDPASDVITFCKLTGIFHKDGKLPALTGLHADVDGTYKSAADLESAIRESRATFYEHCSALIASGKAQEMYMEKKRNKGAAGESATVTEVGGFDGTYDEAAEDVDSEGPVPEPDEAEAAAAIAKLKKKKNKS